LVDLRDLHTVPMALLRGAPGPGQARRPVDNPLSGAPRATLLGDLLAHRPARTLWHAGVAPSDRSPRGLARVSG
jgi:hypothetical protein